MFGENSWSKQPGPVKGWERRGEKDLRSRDPLDELGELFRRFLRDLLDLVLEDEKVARLDQEPDGLELRLVIFL